MQLKINISKFIYIPKSSVIFGIYFVGILLAYWGSLSPWFLWPIMKFYIIISTIFIGTALILDNIARTMLFDRKGWFVPTLFALFVLILQRIVNKGNIFGFTEAFLNAFVIYGIMLLNKDFQRKCIKYLCIIFGSFLAISLLAFFLYLIGFNLPFSETAKEDLMYEFNNFYWFMIDERQFLVIFPRFQSVFLEPGHLGTACALLLFTQIGKWKKWYNVVILIAALLTFSLAAYVLLMIIMTAGAWIQRKKIVAKLITITILLSGIGIASIFYNNGDNLVNTLILSRLEVDENGKLVGDNRVTESFESVYDDYVTTSDVWFGREYSLEEFGVGNAGYRVFIYEYGLICLFLTIIFYSTMSYNPNDKRSWLAMLAVATAGFWVRAIPFSFYFLIPLYSIPFMKIGDKNNFLNKRNNDTEKD